ncbi:MAG TPA: ATP-binding protein [Paracoccaceae bacterium]|nr:ATP-binding protein [Paracoccaceae bacterium]
MTITTEDGMDQLRGRWRTVRAWAWGLLPGKADIEGDPVRLEKQLRDFVNGGVALFWKRQIIYLAALLLTAFFYNVTIAILCYAFCQATDLLDTYVSRRVIAWQGGDIGQARRFRRQLLATSTMSSISVALFVYLVAYMEGLQSHFTPLFFLFAAGLFAAVNNHQIPQILTVRLMIYGAIFLYIPAYDLWVVKPPAQHSLWLHFATAVFVLYFVLDCSFIFLKLYRRGLDQLDELRLQRDRAQESYRVKSQFVSVVSHELRTPLTSIHGALGLLRSGAFAKDPDKAMAILEIAHKNSERLAKLINDLLDLQKLEHGSMTYNFLPTDLGIMVQEAVEGIATFAQPYQVTVQFDRPKKAILALADHDRLMQVLDNLLSNAVKFSRGGNKVVVSLDENGKRARISVRDSGIGIPENSREKVFGRFTQVDSSDLRKHGGTGLGLNISQEIVIAHNGSIDYVSRLGEGTTFFIDLPLIRT